MPGTSATASGRPRAACGLASWALARVLDEARARGMPEVVLVCAPGNVASAKTIERHGGVREDGSWRYRVTLVPVEKL